MAAFHQHHHQQQPRRAWSGLSRKASSNGAAGEKPSCRGLDYAEIFAGFATSCSIPTLDLPPAPDDCGPPSIDYSSIFGGFDPGDFGVPYEELLASERDSKEALSCFQMDFVSEPFIKESKKVNNKVLHKNQFSSVAYPEKVSSACEMENKRVKGYVEVERMNGNKFHDVPVSINVADALGAKCETQSRNTSDFVPNSVSKKYVPPTPDSNLKVSNDGLVIDQLSDWKMCDTPEDIQTNEQYHSCSSSENSVSEDSSLVDFSNNNQHNIKVMDVSSEETFTKASPTSASFTNTESSKKDLRANEKGSGLKSVNTEDVNRYGLLFGISSGNMNQPSFGVGTFSSQSIDGSIRISDSKVRMIDRSTPLGSCISEKVIDGQSKPLNDCENKPASEQPCVNSLNNATVLGERSNNPTTFLKVSDINLRTGPCQVPPPSRAPPKLSGNQVFPKVMMATSKHNFRYNTEVKTHNETTKQEEQSSSDAEVNAGSAAAASVAEAMEHAQARLRTAMELMQKKRDSFHSRRKSLVNEVMNTEANVEEPTLVDGIFEEPNLPDASGTCHFENKAFLHDNRPKTTEVLKVPSDHCGKGEEIQAIFHKKECTAPQPQVSCIDEPSVGEWKVGDQFFEFVNNDKSSKKFPENPEYNSKENIEEAYSVVIEMDSLDGDACNTTCMKKESCDPLTGAAASELDDSDLRDDESVGFSSEVKETNVAAFPFENSKVTTFAVVDQFMVAENILDVSVDENNEKSSNTSDSLQRDSGMDAEKDELINNEMQTCEDDQKVDESFETCNCQTSSEDEPEDNPEVLPEISVFEETNDAEGSPKVLPESFVFEEINVATPEMGCEVNGNILNMQHSFSDFELPEIVKELENPISCSGIDSNNEEYIEESREASNEACHQEELESISEGESVHEKDGNQISMKIQETCEIEDESGFTAPDVISSPHSPRECDDHIPNLDDSGKCIGEDGLPSSPDEQEKQTKEPCWQYFCEKIIGKVETVFPEGDLTQTGSGSSEKKSEVNSQTENEGNLGTKTNHTVMDNEPDVIVDDKLDRNSQGCGTSRTSQKACCTTENNIQELHNASQGISMEFSADAVKIAEKDMPFPIAEDDNKDVSEISKAEEQSKENSKKRDLELEKERMRKLEEEREREKEREKDRQAVEGANRGTRERTFAEAWERAEKSAAERATAEARQRALAEAREKAEKASNEALLLAEKASREAKLRAERAAVERATAEARERAVERALAEKAAQEAKERAERSGWQRKESGADYAKDSVGIRKNTGFSDLRDSREAQKYSSSSNHVPQSNDRLGGYDGESAMRSKAKLERHQRTVERAAKALAEKNLRDTLAQREQAERNRLAETLDADVKRWSSGKEGNLRALLSTLQYILGPESGWQPIHLTEVLTAAAVKKAYRKATLCVHPDKLQQRGANIQQKYICEKVFDLLKDAWNRFNSEER